MILLIVLVGAIWLLLSYRGWSSEVQDRRIILDGEREAQQFMISRQPVIQEGMQNILGRMDPEKMLDAPELAQWVDGLARRASVQNFAIGEASTENRNGLRRHQLRLILDRVPLERLINLVVEIDANRPYILLDEIVMEPQIRTPDFLNVRMRISSQETAPIR